MFFWIPTLGPKPGLAASELSVVLIRYPQPEGSCACFFSRCCLLNTVLRRMQLQAFAAFVWSQLLGVYVFFCSYVYLHIYICVYIYIRSIFVYEYICKYLYVCVYICMYVYIYVSIHACMSVYICMYECM